MPSSVVRHPVASIAAHEFVFGKTDDLVIFNSKCACHRHLGQGRPEQIRSVAGFTPIFISFVKLSVFFIYPAIIIYIVQAVGTACGQSQTPGVMANGILDDGPCVSLELHGGNILGTRLNSFLNA
jgi:hypothetical protein